MDAANVVEPVTKKEDVKTMHTHRVGSITFGCGLVVFGALFLVHLIMPAILSYEMIFHMWPCILILLGIEILIANHKENTTFCYDKTAIVLTVLLTFFAMGMAMADWCIQQVAMYHYW